MVTRKSLLLGVLAALSIAGQAAVNKPDGLLLRGFESAAQQFRRGDAATAAGVYPTLRVDAAGELSESMSAVELAPQVEWIQERGQAYSAYATLSPFSLNESGYVEGTLSVASHSVDLDLNDSGVSIFATETQAALLAVAKAYVDAGVDYIHYDTAWVALGSAGPFDALTMQAFREWLNGRYDLTALQGMFDATYDIASFDFGDWLRGQGVTEANHGDETTLLGGVVLAQSKPWRLWQAFLRANERTILGALVTQVNEYAALSGREVGFAFNRYGFIQRPADRWFLSEYAAWDLGETHFSGQSWDYHKGYSLEPVFRANLKTYGNRFESWNEPPQTSAAVRSVFLAESVVNQGVGTFQDDYPATSGIARMARRFESQLTGALESELAVFYPLATALHTRPGQLGTLPMDGGSHYWYLGAAYLLKDLGLGYDVAFGGDGLGLADAFTATDLAGYPVVVVSEASQVTDNQFTQLLDYANGGGHLVCWGVDNLRYDALGDDQSSVRSYGGLSWGDLFSAVGDVSVGSGTVSVVSLDALGSQYYVDQPEADVDAENRHAAARSLVSAQLPTGLARVEITGASGVRAVSHLDGADGSEVHHLLNYTFNSVGTGVTLHQDLVVTLDPPAAYTGETMVVSYVADSESDPTELVYVEGGDGRLTVTVPSLTYWGILRVGSVMSGNPHPAVPPVAYFNPLFDYEVFRQDGIRSLVYNASSYEGFSGLQVFYQLKEEGTGLFGDWTAGELLADPGASWVENGLVDITLPQEGHYRLQLVATDLSGATNSLMSGSWDTEIGYDTTPPDTSGLSVVETGGGVANDAVVDSVFTPTVQVSGAADSISGISQMLWDWTLDDGSTLDGGGLQGGDHILDLPPIVEGAYGRYTLSVRFQNRAELWDETRVAYSFVYAIPPVYVGAGETRDVMQGDGVSFSLDFSNSYGNPVIEWFKDGELIADQVEASLNLGFVSASASGTYQAIISNVAGSVTSPEFVLSVSVPLEITRQPSGATVNAGESFTLSVEAVGTGELQYQWMLNNVDIPGATGATYTVASADRAQNQGPHRVRVTDDLGEVTSNSAFVTVNGGGGGGGGGLQISQQPQGMNVQEGQPFSLSVQASGGVGTIRYQWMFNGADIPGANGSIYSVASAVKAQHEGNYQVRVMDDVSTLQSQMAVVTVGGSVANGPTITQQPQSTTVQQGQGFSLSVAAVGTGALIYQWTKDGVDLPGATGPNFNVPSAVKSQHEGTYRVRATDPNGTVLSDPAVVTVNTVPAGGPTIGQQPQGVNTVEGSPFALSVQATGAGTLRYQWIKDGIALPGATGPSYSVGAAVKSVHEGSYQVRVMDDSGETMSSMVNVIITPSSGVVFDITIQLPDQGTLIIDVMAEDTVASLKSRLASEVGIPAGEQSLWLAGVELADNQQTLGFYGVQASDVLELQAAKPPGADYGNWSSQHFSPGEPNSQMGDDYDGDGVPNILEYAFGTSPTVGEVHSDNHPKSVRSGDRLRITFRRAIDAADLVWGVDTADDPMGPWITTAQTDWVEISREDQGDGTELVVWENVAGLSGVKFFRVTVSEAALP
ncbi:MAG: hypothetical protein RI897_909 [Verrucomicrobiota bacterium]